MLIRWRRMPLWMAFGFLFNVSLTIQPVIAQSDKEGTFVRSPAEDLLGLLDASILTASLMEPLHVVGDYHQSTTFDGELDNSREMRFRIFKDSQNERYVVGVRSSFRREADPEAEIRYRGTIITGTRVSSSVGSSQNHIKPEKSFRDAVRRNGELDPTFWGFLLFPFYEDPHGRLNRLTAGFVASDSTVSIRQLSETVTASARVRTNEQAWDTYHYTFSLPDYLPTKVRLERHMDGYDPRDSYSQTTIWEEVGGMKRPTTILATKTAIRRINGANGPSIEPGIIQCDLQAKWFDPNLSSPTMDDFGSAIEIDDFVEATDLISASR